MLNEILNHKKTLAFLVNQHTNFTHPKLLTIPRGNNNNNNNSNNNNNNNKIIISITIITLNNTTRYNK